MYRRSRPCRIPNRQRRGTVLPLVTVSLVALFGFVALAVDIGMIALARTEAQGAADIAAMAGARTLNGDATADNNSASAPGAATTAATINTILGKNVGSGHVNIELGSYSYNDSLQKFESRIPKVSSDNWSLARVQVDQTNSTSFARVFGVPSFNTTAQATAVHRPRDVAIILDISGTMRYDSLLGIPHNGNRDGGTGNTENSGSNNPDTVFPRFGHYSDTAKAGLQRSSAATIGSEFYNLANITVETTSGPPIIDYFYQHASGSTTSRAFTSASDVFATAPNGDDCLKSGANYIKTVKDLTGGTTRDVNFETNGYQQFVSNFHGFTQGPRYWGKTFFVWPPDPRADKDWRKKFFLKTDGTSPQDDNTKLWDGTGNWRAPSDNYRINYAAILDWIKNTGPNPFPARLRSGRILYYDAIPDSITGSSPSDPNERFWKKYIDYVVGVYQSGSSSWEAITPQTGYGHDYTWGTVKISAKPTTGSPPPYMDYEDNPKRPRLHLWFGPLTMVDFLGNHNRANALSYAQHYWWPGTCTEAPNYACKLGMRAALQDIQQNHPNDLVTLIMFSDPQYFNGDMTGRFNTARVGLGREYTRMIDSLWFPQATIDSPGTEVRYDDVDGLEVPRAFGQTSFAMPLMLAYNQFSSDTSLRSQTSPSGLAGGLGRRGARKMIVLETDGQPNYYANASWTDGGVSKSYYNIVPPANYPSQTGSGITSQIYGIVDRIVADETSALRGYSTKNKPVLIHCIAYGNMFEPYSSDPDQGGALSLMQTLQFKGKTQTSAGESLPSYKLITGTNEERIEKMRQAFSTIMQDGVQVSLIE